LQRFFCLAPSAAKHCAAKVRIMMPAPSQLLGL